MAKAAARNQAAKSHLRSPAATRMSGATEFHWAWLYLGSAGLLLALAVFSPALGGSFVFDDYHLPFAQPHAAEMPASFWIGGVRPVLIATYWLNFLISGTRPFSYHLVNLILHAAAALLLFFIYERLFTISGAAFERRSFALFGAALFLLHPLQTESVDYIAGRSELVSGLFFFAAWFVFLQNFEKETGFIQTGVILFLACLAVLGKESAISLPAVLLLTDLHFAREPIREHLTRRWRLYSLFVLSAMSGAFLILRSLTKGTAAGFSSGASPFEYALTECRAILIYLRLFFIPAGQNGDWQLPFFHSLVDGAAWSYTAALVLLLAFTIWLYRRDRLASFGLASFFVMLAPTSSIVPIRDALAERRMYVPLAGLILAVLALAGTRLSSLPLLWRRALAVGALAICGVLSYHRSTAWQSDFDLWQASVRANPDNARAHFGLGSAMMIRQDCAGAAHEFEAARSLDRSKTELSSAEVLWNLAEANQCSQRLAAALTAYQAFAAENPTATAYDQIGYIQAMQGQTDAALDAFEKALNIDPNDSTAYAYRGLAELALEHDLQARADFEHALQLNPQNQTATTGLARLAEKH